MGVVIRIVKHNEQNCMLMSELLWSSLQLVYFFVSMLTGQGRPFILLDVSLPENELSLRQLSSLLSAVEPNNKEWITAAEGVQTEVIYGILHI